MNFRRMGLLTGGLLFGIALIVVAMLALRRESVDDILAGLERDNFSGVVLIAHGDEVLHQAGYGFASCDDSIANSADTVQAIGSITKMFTAVAIAQLDARGELNIDEPISNYFDTTHQIK